MKKVVVIIINIVILYLLFLLVPFIDEKIINSINKHSRLDRMNINSENIDISMYQSEDDSFLERIEPDTENFGKYCGEERLYYGEEYYNDNRPILLVGCSYVYGQGIQKEDTFGAILSEITKRPVISTAHCGDNAYTNINTIIENDLTDKVKNSEYVIYLFMYDHISRYLNKKFIFENYDNLFNTNKTEQFLNKIKIFKYIMANYRFHKIIKDYPNSDETALFIKSCITNWCREIKKYAPNSKIIIILYNEKILTANSNSDIKFFSDILNSNIWSEIAQEEDITVIRTKDLVGFYFDRNYKLKRDFCGAHPNSKVWRTFVPIFADKYIL